MILQFLPIGIVARGGTWHCIWYPLSQASQNNKLLCKKNSYRIVSTYWNTMNAWCYKVRAWFGVQSALRSDHRTHHSSGRWLKCLPTWMGQKSIKRVNPTKRHSGMDHWGGGGISCTAKTTQEKECERRAVRKHFLLPRSYFCSNKNYWISYSLSKK